MACAAIPVGADEMPHDADWQVECEGKPLRLTALRTQDGGTCWFASFESVGGRRVRVTAPDGTVETTFPMRPFRRVIDSNGGKGALVLFGNGPEKAIPDRKDPKVRWYGPGAHRVGEIRLESNETLYLDPAATVYGALFAAGTNITVTGHGALIGSLALVRCNRVRVEGVRIFGDRGMNDCGIAVIGSGDIRLHDIFVRSAGDAFSLRGLASDGIAGASCANVSLEDATLWSDAASVFRIGDGEGPVCNVSIRNVDVRAASVANVRSTCGQLVENVLFDNVCVRSDACLLSAESFRGGCVTNVVLRNVACAGKAGICVGGQETGGRVDGVVFQNVTRDEAPVGAGAPDVKISPSATVMFATDARYRNLYVDPEAGDDANDGRAPEHALHTLARAVSLLRAGDVLELKPGATFRESLVFSASGGTPERPIVVHGNGAVLTGRGWKGPSFHSGVAICRSDYITVENLIAEHFRNDGFNVHGACRGLVFRNIVGRYNSDDGFSIHDQVMANVYGGTFYGNDYGIEDIGKSQSSYCGVSAVSNRVCGISLVGGARIIRESAACGNGKAEVEVRNQSRRADYYDAKDPFYRAKVLLELVRIGSGGESSLDVGEGACVTLQRCSVGGMKRIAPSAEVVFLESVE